MEISSRCCSCSWCLYGPRIASQLFSSPPSPPSGLSPRSLFFLTFAYVIMPTASCCCWWWLGLLSLLILQRNCCWRTRRSSIIWIIEVMYLLCLLGEPILSSYLKLDFKFRIKIVFLRFAFLINCLLPSLSEFLVFLTLSFTFNPCFSFFQVFCSKQREAVVLEAGYDRKPISWNLIPGDMNSWILIP